MVFVQGDLAQVCIYKKSELVQFALIPLEVVKKHRRLCRPRCYKIQYDQITQSTALVAAENKVLQSQNKLLALLQNPNSATDPGAPGGAPANFRHRWLLRLPIRRVFSNLLVPVPATFGVMQRDKFRQRSQNRQPRSQV